MKELDKVSLLFEMLFETDLVAVNRKIYEIKVSKEYNRLSEAVVALSDTEPMREIIQRYNKLDIEGILTYDRALEVQKEIKELDQKVNFIKNFNPYLANADNAIDYGVKTVGDINVEVSAKNQKVNDFTSKKGVTAPHRRKVMAIKAFSWYKEAKKQIYLLIENSKMFLSRIRYSKVRYKSLSFQTILMVLLMILTFGFVFFAPNIAEGYQKVMIDFRKGILTNVYPLNGNIIQTIGTISMYVMCAAFALFYIIRTHYYYYGYRVASKMRSHVEKQEHIVNQLDETSIKFERDLMKRIKRPHKVKTSIASVGILSDESNFSFNEVFDYMYNEKEYYFAKHKFLLVIANILFAICLIASFLVILLPFIVQLPFVK